MYNTIRAAAAQGRNPLSLTPATRAEFFGDDTVSTLLQERVS
jgi:hypothetical protein